MKTAKSISLNVAIIFPLLVLVGLMLPGITISAGKHKQDVPLVVLKTSGPMTWNYGMESVSSIYTSSSDNQTLYLVNGFTGEVGTYREQNPASPRLSTNTFEPEVSSRNGYTVYQDQDLMVVTLDPTGKQVARFPTYPAYSLGVLSNGNVVVASPVGNNFLHVYNSAGRLLQSFGKIKNYALPDVDNAEKQFLRRGEVLVDANDNVRYVFNFVPVIQKYSPGGKLLFERQAQGKAIDIQQDIAQRFFTNKAQGVVGGIYIINSGAIDLETGHLWICMNGSSTTGVVYEYSEQGDKIREYALEGYSPLPSMRRITGAKDIAITRSGLHIVTAQQVVLSFDIRDNSTWNSVGDDMSTQDEAPCGTAQPWDSCTFNCPGLTCVNNQPTATSSNGLPLDCKAALQATLSSGYTLISSSCTQYAVGFNGNPTQGIPPHMRGACKNDIVTCRDGQNTSGTITIDCPAPTASCSG